MLQQNDAKNLKKMTGTLEHGYSSESRYLLLTRTTQEVRLRMCMSNLLYNVNKYESPHWSETRFGRIRCVQGFIMGTMVIVVWRPVHVLVI